MRQGRARSAGFVITPWRAADVPAAGVEPGGAAARADALRRRRTRRCRLAARGQGRVVDGEAAAARAARRAARAVSAGMPCVTVTAIDPSRRPPPGCSSATSCSRCAASRRRRAGKRATTVLRSAAVANRAFGHASGELELRLAHYNREVKLTKVGGVAGVAVAPSSTAVGRRRPPGFAGVAVSSKLKPDGAGVAAGLHVGDHVLSVNAKLCHGDADRAGQLLRESPAALKLVLRGETRAIDARLRRRGAPRPRLRPGGEPPPRRRRRRHRRGGEAVGRRRRQAADGRPHRRRRRRAGRRPPPRDRARDARTRRQPRRERRPPPRRRRRVGRRASAPGAEPRAAGGSLKATGGDAVGGGDGGDGGAGAQADFYYSHDVLRGAPAGLGPVYEDLTTRSVS